MKKSELLFRQADEADNDFQFWAKHHNAEREQRREQFEEQFLPTIMSSPLVSSVLERNDGDMYAIEFTDGTKVDYYPKKDRAMIHRPNQWKSYGRTWILNKINSK